MCETMYGEKPQYNWALEYFGGINPKKDFMSASNIIFSNGTLDPWHAGGVLEEINDKTVVLYMNGSAHHLDLRLPNEYDPIDVKNGRDTEIHTIAGWIDEYQGTCFQYGCEENLDTPKTPK